MTILIIIIIKDNDANHKHDNTAINITKNSAYILTMITVERMGGEAPQYL